MANTPPIQGIIRARREKGYDPLGKSSYRDWVKRLQVIFENLATAKKKYFQLRYLDEKGTELVRVDFDGKKARVVPEAELQNKGDRYYFRQAMKLKAGEIYVSRMDLNREEGKIQIPHLPTLRYATPVFDESGQSRGIIIANLFAQKVVHQPLPAPEEKESFLFVADERGFYRYHSRDEAKEYGGPIDLATGENLKKDYPGIADQILSGKGGDAYSKGLEIFYAPIRPYKEADRFWVIGHAVPQKIVLAPLRNFIVFFIFIMALIFAAVVLFSIFISRIIAGPLSRLKKAADSAAEGKYEEAIVHARSVKSGDELEDLGRHMAASKKIILQDIQELQKVDRMKSEFLAVISHELRTPLTPIKGYLAMFKQGVGGDLTPGQKDMTDKINSAVVHLEHLINSILDISRLESGQKFEAEKKPCNLAEELKHITAVLKANFDNKKIKLELDLAPDLPAIMADEAKIDRLITDLLDNALKFTPKYGSVKVAAQALDKEVIVKISDSGIGIAKDQLEKIFERFYQVDSSYTRAYGGIGMGLTVAKEIVEAHGGKIRAASAGPGKGSTFTFTLPIS